MAIKMFKIFKKFSTKISIYFLIFSVLLVLVLSYRNYEYSVELIRNSKIEETKQQLKNAGTYISSYLEKMKKLASFLAMTPSVSNFEQNKQEEVKSLLDLSIQNEPLVKRVLVIYENGKLLTSSKHEEGCLVDSDKKVGNKFDLLLSDNMRKLEWYQNLAKEQNMAVVTSENHREFSMNKSERVISVSHVIRRQNREVGYVIIDLSYKFVEDYVSSVNFGEKGYTFITTGEEKLLFDSQQMGSDLLVEQEKYIQIIKNRMKMLEPGFIAAKIDIPGTDWLLVGVASNEEILELKDKLISNSLKLILFIFLATLVLSILISRWISSPLTNLVAEMKK